MRVAKRYLEAFKEDLNIIGLTAAAALSAATLNPLPLLASLVAEAAYLLYVPDSRWYDSRRSKRYDAEVESRRAQLKDRIVPTLRQQLQERFTQLEQMRIQINAQSIEGEAWFRDVLSKLDYLLEKFLMFASRETQFRSYLDSVRHEMAGEKQRAKKNQTLLQEPPPVDGRRRGAPVSSFDKGAHKQSQAPPDEAVADTDEQWVKETVVEIQCSYDNEIAKIVKAREQEREPDTLAILEKRLEVIERRKEFVGRMQKVLLNLNHQLRLVEDTFGLINDELRARSPEQLLADIEEVVGQTESMTRVLEEIAPYEQMVARMQQSA